MTIEIDLDSLTDGIAVPHELGVILGEIRDDVERMKEYKSQWRKPIRNFESEVIGFVRVSSDPRAGG